MAGSSFGNIFKITTWGESHGKALGVVIDGVPAGLKLSEKDIQPFMDRRAPGKSNISTPRNEADEAEILSGTMEGITTGCPISIMVRNTSQHSSDYSNIKDIYRPGHADYTYDAKYGIRDYRGGGRSSGRETIGRVAAGAVASKILKELNIDVCSYTLSIGPVSIDRSNFDRSLITCLPTCMPDSKADKEAVEYINGLREDKDSAGGVIETVIKGMPAGIGDPVFEKLSANLSKAIMSIGAVKAVEFGDGFKVAGSTGSENNDAFRMSGDEITKITNHSGGLLGGMSDGSDIIIRCYIKPTPSIFKTQETVSKDKEDVSINIKGRHDPVIVPRAVVVVESMCAITLVDALMTNMSSKLGSLTDFYLK
ncbi:MAG: chorismate synthase [Lachnospiraceae bacterium]|nr:chorismate synthase [Lachnospiraceae bacterium]